MNKFFILFLPLITRSQFDIKLSRCDSQQLLNVFNVKMKHIFSQIIFIDEKCTKKVFMSTTELELSLVCGYKSRQISLSLSHYFDIASRFEVLLFFKSIEILSLFFSFLIVHLEKGFLLNVH
jgi:hypothetical protein